jgi:microcystin-dependent protein
MAQPYIGQVIAVGFNFVPVNWLACDGTLYPISEYDALYTLIGTSYGGDGVTTFAVPDLRGRSPVNAGQGPGYSTYFLGQSGGSESVTLTAQQVGSHSHSLMTSSQTASASTPATTAAVAVVEAAKVKVFGSGNANTTLSGNSIAPAGGSQPHENRQPFLAVNYIICYAGIFPPQS